MSWHLGPLAGFDVESTGTDPECARIVTASILQRGPEDRDQSWLVNCGDIPAEATAIHGVSTEDAAAGGVLPCIALAEITDELHRLLSAGIPLVIYNAPYDLTVVDRETRRHGLQPFADVFAEAGGLVVDPLVLDKHLDRYRKGRRTLAAACGHYGVALGEAHNSAADTLAAMRVAWRIAATFPQLAAMDRDALHKLQADAKAEQAAGFAAYLRRQGKPEDIDGSWPMRAYAGVAA